MIDYTVWHDEAERFEHTGKLDPVDGCLCAECTAARER
jgi:hypothetical protein